MSDPHDRDEVHIVSTFTPGGHEHDEPDWRRLFIMLLAAGVLTIGAGFGVAQFFNWQARTAEHDAAAVKSERLVQYEQRMQELSSGYGVVDRDKGLFRAPLDVAARIVLADPAGRMAPGPRPADFVHPDDEPKAQGGK